MMPNKSLTEILDEYYPLHDFMPEMSTKIRLEAKAAILTLFRSLVPEECPGCGWKHDHPKICQGWNDCRQEILDRLNKLEKGE